MSQCVDEADSSGRSFWSSLNSCSLPNPILSLELPTLNLRTRLPIYCSGSHYGWTSACTSSQLLLSSSVRHLCVPKLISDFFVLEEKFRPPASTTGAAALAGSFGLIYSAWIEHASAINGKFPYPFLNVMSIDQRIIFYIVSVVGALATFRFLNSLHR
jgi:hypothetical protein